MAKYSQVKYLKAEENRIKRVQKRSKAEHTKIEQRRTEYGIKKPSGV